MRHQLSLHLPIHKNLLLNLYSADVSTLANTPASSLQLWKQHWNQLLRLASSPRFRVVTRGGQKHNATTKRLACNAPRIRKVPNIVYSSTSSLVSGAPRTAPTLNAIPVRAFTKTLCRLNRCWMIMTLESDPKASPKPKEESNHYKKCVTAGTM